MSIFAIIKNGVVQNIIVADMWPDAVNVTNLNPRPSIGWIYDGTTFSPHEHAPNIRHITRLAFWQRFTQEERIAIDLYSIDNPSATMIIRQQAAALRDLITQVNAATFIDLDRPDTRGGTQQLETMGLLATGRSTIILDAEIQDIERPL